MAKAKTSTPPAGEDVSAAISAVSAAVGELAGGSPSSGMAISVGIIPTGNEVIDGVIGRGGLPAGNVSVFVGEKGAGKTTAGLQACAAVQRAGGIAIYLDAERKVRRDRAEQLGVDWDALVYRRPNHVEGAMAALDAAIRAIARVSPTRPVVAVLDSVNATISHAESISKKGYLDVQPGVQARAYSATLRRFVEVLGDSNCALIFIGQLRQKIGTTRGAKWTIGVGNAIEFYTVLMLYFRLAGYERVDTDTPPIGIRVEIEVVKNQIAPPFEKGEYTLMFRDGVDRLRALIEWGLRVGVLGKAGTGWITYGSGDDAKKWNGLKRMKRDLITDPDLLAQIRAEVRARYGE